MSGPQCCSNPPTINPSSGSGHVEKLGGLDSYVTGSPDSKLAILLVSDIFGFEAPNLRKLADKVAAAGFFVVVPDFLYGDPYAPEDANRPLPVWIKDHGPANGFEDAKPVLGALRRKGFSAVGAAGFCWGGKVVVELAKHDFIQAAVLCHPSFVIVDDIKAVKVPISILGAEIDHMSPPEVVKQFEEVLTAKSEVKSHVKIFPKVAHGWTVRYNVEDEAAVKCAEEAHQNLLEWFLNHVRGIRSSLLTFAFIRNLLAHSNREAESVFVHFCGSEKNKQMSGPQCCSNPPTLDPSGGSGHVEKFGGLDTYVTGSPDSKLAILLASDIFGYDAPNLRKLADKVAAAGFFVVVPDFFYGDPFVPGDDGSYANLPTWLKDHGPDKAFEESKPVLEVLKSKGVSAVGAAGFCYGAKVVVELSKHDFIQAAVLCHPSFVTLDDIKAVKVPISILGAEIDKMSPPEVVKQFEEALTAKSEIECHVKIFPKVAHGWTVRYNVEDEAAVKAAEEAHQDLLEWFLNHVK